MILIVINISILNWQNKEIWSIQKENELRHTMSIPFARRGDTAPHGRVFPPSGLSAWRKMGLGETDWEDIIYDVPKILKKHGLSPENRTEMSEYGLNLPSLKSCNEAAINGREWCDLGADCYFAQFLNYDEESWDSADGEICMQPDLKRQLAHVRHGEAKKWKAQRDSTVQKHNVKISLPIKKSNGPPKRAWKAKAAAKAAAEQQRLRQRLRQRAEAAAKAEAEGAGGNQFLTPRGLTQIPLSQRYSWALRGAGSLCRSTLLSLVGMTIED